MTCKDCIHFDVCKDKWSYELMPIFAPYSGKGQKNYMDGMENKCQAFKPKSRFVELPCEVGQTVYHITSCKYFHGELDGNLYNSDGSLGDATGYYCPCELRDNCPFDNDEDCDCNKQKVAIFEDNVKGFLIGEYEETLVFLEYSLNVSEQDFGKTVFLSREEAEKALAERSK